MTAAIVPGKGVPVHQPSPPPPTRPRRAQRFPFSVCSHSNGVYATLDNGGAHCACAAPRASPSPAPSERARPSGSPRPLGPSAQEVGGCTEGELLEAALCLNAPLPYSLFSSIRGLFFRLLSPFCSGGRRAWRVVRSLESLHFSAACLPLAVQQRFSRPRLEAWNLHRQGFLAARFLFMLCRLGF